MNKHPEEIPDIPKQPEIIPPQDPVGPSWPSHNPEVIPEKEPAPVLIPEEVPPPPTKGIHFI